MHAHDFSFLFRNVMDAIYEHRISSFNKANNNIHIHFILGLKAPLNVLKCLLHINMGSLIDLFIHFIFPVMWQVEGSRKK